MIIKQYGKFEPTFQVEPGDTFTLNINDTPVHSQRIDTKRNISFWAIVELNGNIGYFIGDYNLILDLTEIGFRQKRPLRKKTTKEDIDRLLDMCADKM